MHLKKKLGGGVGRIVALGFGLNPGDHVQAVVAEVVFDGQVVDLSEKRCLCFWYILYKSS
jgi:hypothetical protein